MISMVASLLIASRQLPFEELAKSVQVVVFRSNLEGKTITGFASRWKNSKVPKKGENIRITCQYTTGPIGSVTVSNSENLAKKADFPVVVTQIREMSEKVAIVGLSQKNRKFKLGGKQYLIRRDSSNEISISGPPLSGQISVNNSIPVYTSESSKPEITTWTFIGVKNLQKLSVNLSWEKVVQSSKTNRVPVVSLEKITLPDITRSALLDENSESFHGLEQIPKEVVALFPTR